jgi:hypothetical protein
MGDEGERRLRPALTTETARANVENVLGGEVSPLEPIGEGSARRPAGFRHPPLVAPARQRNGERERDVLAALDRAYAAIVDDARAQVAAGREPALDTLEKRLRAETRSVLGARESQPAVERAERRALEQLAAVAKVFRARTLLAAESEPSPAPPPPTRQAPSFRSLLRSKPTISANMDVRRGAEGGGLSLTWDPVPAVVEWEVRFSERPDPRGGWVPLDTVALPPGETTIEVPIGEHLYRIHIVGRSRDGRPLRRALISGLTRETWNDRWERRASAA